MVGYEHRTPLSFVACGINHKTAPLSLRERTAFIPDQIPDVLQNLMKQTSVEEALILSTCNRTEVYACGCDPGSLISWLRSEERRVGKECRL